MNDVSLSIATRRTESSAAGLDGAAGADATAVAVGAGVCARAGVETSSALGSARASTEQTRISGYRGEWVAELDGADGAAGVPAAPPSSIARKNEALAEP